MRRVLAAGLLLALSVPAFAAPCTTGVVFEDRNGNGIRDAREPGLAGILVSDGEHLVRTGADGRYQLPVSAATVVSLVKPAGWNAARRGDGLPDTWRHRDDAAAVQGGQCRPFALRRAARAPATLTALLFADPQTANATEVDYYARDIIEPLLGRHGAHLGLTLGDITNDDPALYPALTAQTTRLGVPWLHIPGNHDMDKGAGSDAEALASYQRAYGPDTFAWEEEQATFIGLDDVVYQPGMSPAYIGGLREDQFAFLQAYLPTARKDRLLVIGVHIPFFEPGPRGFRTEDRERLFAMLEDFPHVLLLSGHTHAQQHWYHDASTGWRGAKPLHEYNVGAACGAFWSGVTDAAGIPVTTMADGTTNGYGLLHVDGQGGYTLEYRAARAPADAQMHLHAPKVLRQGAYPAWGIYANVWMGDQDTVVEFRVDDGDWQPMKRIVAPDPALLLENAADDLADTLRSFDRSPEAKPSTHLWRGALPTQLAVGEHRVEVRARLAAGEYRASTTYRLDAAMR